jgi:hypothetical protein
MTLHTYKIQQLYLECLVGKSKKSAKVDECHTFRPHFPMFLLYPDLDPGNDEIDKSCVIGNCCDVINSCLFVTLPEHTTSDKATCSQKCATTEDLFLQFAFPLLSTCVPLARRYARPTCSKNYV